MRPIIFEKVNILSDQTHIGHRKRMRERILKNGFDSLFPHEVLEYILFGCIAQGDTNALAHRLIAAFGGFEEVFEASIPELTAIHGIGETAALYLKSFEHVAKVFSNRQFKEGIYLGSLGAIREYLQEFFSAKSREEFHVLLLDGNKTLLRHIVMASPITDKVYVDMSEVMVAIASLEPSAVVFAHNHPSGICKPSQNDIAFTQRYFSAIHLTFNISVCEHMIFTKDGGCYSFRNGGELELIRRSIEKANNIIVADSCDLGGFNE